MKVIARKTFPRRRTCRHRKRDLARQSRSGSGLNRKLYYLSLPEMLKQFFLRGRHNPGRDRHAWKNDHDRVARLDPNECWNQTELHDRWHPEESRAGRAFNDSKYFVIEGDEYDTAFFDKRSKFIHYLPEWSIVNNIEFDHADIFRDLDEIKLSFRRLINIVPQNGMILLNGDDPNCVEVAQNCSRPWSRLVFRRTARRTARNVSHSSAGSHFSLGEELDLPLIGEFNVRNAAMAISAALRTLTQIVADEALFA